MKKLYCPNAHSIPHRTPQGECTPVYCAVDPTVIAPSPLAKKRAKENARANINTTFELQRVKAIEKSTKALIEKIKREDIQLPEGADRGLANDGRLEVLAGASIAVGKRAARMAFTPDMPAPDADDVTINDWADKRVLKNLAQAIAEKEFQLHFGDDEQRDKAADTFIKMNGRHEKEGKVSGGALIVIHQGSAPEGTTLSLPYMPKTINGEVIKK